MYFLVQAQEKSIADAAFYKILREAESNKLLFTTEYLELKRYEALAANQKIYFGPDIPNTFISTANDFQATKTGPEIAATIGGAGGDSKRS